MENSYKILNLHPAGVDPDTNAPYTESKIKAAYRAAALKSHPDKGGDAEVFKSINNAYDILREKKTRKELDEHLRTNPPSPQDIAAWSAFKQKTSLLTQRLRTEPTMLRRFFTEVTEGSAHGNFMRLIYTLIKAGICTLNQQYYNELVAIYESSSSCTPDTENRIENEITQFKKIINENLQVICTDKVYRLIGNFLAGPGPNDFFILYILHFLHKHEVRFRIIFSKYDDQFLRAFFSDFDPTNTSFTWARQNGQGRSLLGLQASIEQNIILFEDVKEMVEEAYLPYLMLYDYSLDENNNLTLYSYKPHKIKMLRSISNELFFRGILNDENLEDVSTLQVIINQVNLAFSAFINDGELYCPDFEVSNKSYSKTLRFLINKINTITEADTINDAYKKLGYRLVCGYDGPSLKDENYCHDICINSDLEQNKLIQSTKKNDFTWFSSDIVNAPLPLPKDKSNQVFLCELRRNSLTQHLTYMTSRNQGIFKQILDEIETLSNDAQKRKMRVVIRRINAIIVQFHSYYLTMKTRQDLFTLFTEYGLLVKADKGYTIHQDWSQSSMALFLNDFIDDRPLCNLEKYNHKNKQSSSAGAALLKRLHEQGLIDISALKGVTLQKLKLAINIHKISDLQLSPTCDADILKKYLDHIQDSEIPNSQKFYEQEITTHFKALIQQKLGTKNHKSPTEQGDQDNLPHSEAPPQQSILTANEFSVMSERSRGGSVQVVHDQSPCSSQQNKKNISKESEEYVQQQSSQSFAVNDSTTGTSTYPIFSPASSIHQAPQERDAVVAKLTREDSPFTYLPISKGKDCLYNAVIEIEKVILKEKALFGDVETLRSFLADHVTLNPDRYKYTLKDFSNNTFGAYVKGIREGKEPGNIEISALMYLLSRTIVIVQSDGNTLYWDKVDLFKTKPIFVFYNPTEKHYDALILKQGFDARQIAESMPTFFTPEALEEPNKLLAKPPHETEIGEESKPAQQGSQARKQKQVSFSPTLTYIPSSVVTKLTGEEDSPFCYLPISKGKDCLYNAVIANTDIKSVYNNAQSLRERVLKHLTKHQKSYKSIKDFFEKDFDADIEEIKNGTDGGNIKALMSTLNRAIVIVQSDGNTMYWNYVDAFQNEPIFVFYNPTEKHYDALILKKGFNARKIAESMPAFFTPEALEEPKKTPTATLQGAFFPQALKQEKAGQETGQERVFTDSKPTMG